MKRELTAERLREVVDYSPETGAFTWKVKLNRRLEVGGQVGSTCHGYMKTRIDGVEYLLHRLAWLYVVGDWPAEQIDHINGDRKDNRFVNLRDASGRVNAQNKRKPHRDNSSGFMGVVAEKGRWRAQIGLGNRSVYIGAFSTPEEAHEAYLSAKRQLHEGCTL